MDKQEFIDKALQAKDINNNIAFLNSNSIEAVISIVSEYCIEKGKDRNFIPIFIQVSCQTGMIKGYYNIALSYYLIKFNLNCLYKEDKLIGIYSNN